MYWVFKHDDFSCKEFYYAASSDLLPVKYIYITRFYLRFPQVLGVWSVPPRGL